MISHKIFNQYVMMIPLFCPFLNMKITSYIVILAVTLKFHPEVNSFRGEFYLICYMLPLTEAWPEAELSSTQGEILRVTCLLESILNISYKNTRHLPVVLQLVHEIGANFDQKRNISVNKHSIYQNFANFM